MMILNYYDKEPIKSDKSIFLAGPTPRKKEVKSWRGEAISLLKEIGFDGVVYIPEFESFSNMPNDENILKELFLWEREALTNAKAIVFWIPRSIPDMPGFTTNVEFGYWLGTNKVIYGRPNGTINTTYLDWLYEIDYKKKAIDNLHKLLIEAKKKVDC